MFIISIEGTDKSGKFSAAKALTESLQSSGFDTVQAEFPNYDSPIGNLLGQWLRGEFDADQATFELLQAADKQSQQAWFARLERQGVSVLVLDRYVGAQTAYAVANGVDYDFTEALQHYMRQPDLTILLDLAPEVSMRRKGKHNDGENDRYESDFQLLSDVRGIYKEMLLEKDLCIDATKEMSVIHEEVLSYVKEFIAAQPTT